MFIKLMIPVALVAGLATPAVVKGGFPGHGWSSVSPAAFLEAKLKLSTDQKSALHEVFKRHRPALAEKVQTVVQARNAALDAGMDPSVTQEAWRVQQEQMADAVYGLAKEIRSAYLEALPVLTDAQKTAGKALLKKAHSHMEGMHGRHHAFALGFVKHRLELTDAQSAAIQTILENHKTALEAKAEGLHKATSAAQEVGLDPAATQVALDQQFAAVREAGMALSSEVRSAYLEMVPQLTPDQREAAKGLMKDFREAVDGVRKLALGF